MGKEKINPFKVAEGWRIKKKGLFDLSKLFAIVPAWFDKNKFDFFEKAHDEKINPDGKQIKSEWFARREVNSYVRFIFNVEILVRRCIEVVVEEDGEKTEKHKGWIEIVINSEMEKNYEKEKRRKFLRGEIKGTFDNFMKILYEKTVAKRSLDVTEGKLKTESLELLETLKDVVEKS